MVAVRVPLPTSTSADRVQTSPGQERFAGRHFFGPAVDFFLLGGISLVLLPIAVLLPSNLSSEVRALMLAVALFINGPHFAHSYQLFYRDFQAKTRSTEYGRTLRLRYALSGIAVPVVLGAFLIGAMAAADTGLLAAAGNAMAFFVGWHYVKQGYGMLIVDGVMRQQFFTPIERRVMLTKRLRGMGADLDPGQHRSGGVIAVRD